MTRRVQNLVVSIIAVVAAVVPLGLADRTFYIDMVLSAVMVTGLSLFIGYAGQISLVHGAVVAASALSVAVMPGRLTLPPAPALVSIPGSASTVASRAG